MSCKVALQECHWQTDGPTRAAPCKKPSFGMGKVRWEIVGGGSCARPKLKNI